MKTLTTTFHFGTNYGATLQAYALQQIIIGLGHENEILDIIDSPDPTTNKFSIRCLIRKLYFKYLKFKRKKSILLLRQHFIDFHRERMYLTKKYKDFDELRYDSKMQEYDALITGSDQVWNLHSRPNFADSRLLMFGSEKAIRFSYAASLEELNYTDEQKNKVTNALKFFDGISIREESACKYIESFSGIKCKRMIDPVFLLTKEEWKRIAVKPRLDGPYILCYQVQGNSRMEEVAYELKRKTGYPIVSICNLFIKWMKSDYTFYDVSIEEFLGFYDQSAYIISASFHGISMGMVFDKPVYAMVKRERANRLREVMELMGLKDYIIEQGKKDEIKDYVYDDIIKMQSIKNEERNKGISFIKSNLS